MLSDRRLRLVVAVALCVTTVSCTRAKAPDQSAVVRVAYTSQWSVIDVRESGRRCFEILDQGVMFAKDCYEDRDRSFLSGGGVQSATETFEVVMGFTRAAATTVEVTLEDGSTVSGQLQRGPDGARRFAMQVPARARRAVFFDGIREVGTTVA
jgi:hypothetical protein